MTAPAVLYIRVSSAEQVAGTSLATQERDCRAACARLGLEVRAVFRDEGKSAKSTVGRDGLAAAIAEAERCKGVLIVHKFDRLARNTRDALTVRDTLLARGCRILSASEGDAAESPFTKAMFTMASAFAELDNSIRAERSRRGMQERADAGGWCFAAPVGFRLARNERGVPVLAADEERAPAIRAAFASLADGTATELGAVRAIMDGAKCCRKTAYGILRAPIYKGVLPAGKLGPERPAAFPGLVAPEVWDAAQANLSTTQIGIPRMNANPSTPLVGVLHCAECGKRMVGGFSRGRHGARFGYYRCPKCGVSIPFAKAEEQVRDAIEVVARCGDFLRLVRTNLKMIDELENRPEKIRAEEAEARRVIARQTARLNRARDAFVDGLFTREEFDALRVECELKLADARAVIGTRAKWEGRREEMLDALLVIAADPSRILALPPLAAKDALRALCGRVTVGRDKVLRFPAESSVEVLRAVAPADGAGFNLRELAPLLSALLKRDGCGLIRAAAALRAG